MDVTTMHSTTSIISQLKNSHPEISFEPGDDFYWSPSDRTIFFDKNNPDQTILLLHEIGHALLGHSTFGTDIELLAMERQAWDKSVEVAKEFEIEIPDDFIQMNLDGYRNWLHSRSTCPNCTAIGFQIKKLQYTCPSCNYNWTVNEARTCALRRYNKKRT